MDNKDGKLKNILLAGAFLLFVGILIYVLYRFTLGKNTSTLKSPEKVTDNIVSIETPTKAPIITSVFIQTTSTPVPTATTKPTAIPTSGLLTLVNPTSTPVPSATPTIGRTTYANPTPTSVPSYGGSSATSTPRPTSTTKAVVTKTPSGSTLPDAGVSYPTIMMVVLGGFLLIVSALLI